MSSKSRHHSLYLAGIALLAVAAICLLTLAVSGLLLSRSPRRGPYLQSVTPDSVWVVWDTNKAEIGRVEYGPTPKLGQVLEEDQAQFHHELQLTGLLPYSENFYRVDQGRVFRFRSVAGPDQAHFRFAVFGDTREGVLTHWTLVRRMVKSEPDFVLHTGDMVEFGAHTRGWDEFFRIEAPLLATAPFFPTLGNHEDEAPNYFDAFHLPGNEMWYAFDYGQARFICLKADGYPANVYFPEEQQLAWLEDQLASNTQPWLFVYFHITVYTSREEGFLETGMRARLVPLFERYGVDAVFMGHAHSYERLIVNGITYIVTAGGGASLYDLGVPEAGSQVAQRAYHFVLIELDGDHLTGTAIAENGKVIDQFELVSEK